MPNKPKKTVKSKEQIAHEMYNAQEIARKRDIIVNEFYPALIRATISVDESKALIHAMSSLLMEDVLKTMKERKFADIAMSLQERLTTDGERVEEIAALLATLANENLFVAREIIEGMTAAIEASITEEMRERNLSTLKTNWEQYLN